MNKYQDNDTIRRILRRSRVIAVVGLSDKPDRPSNRVASYLQRAGYKIIPVNPRISEALGEKSYPDLKSIPENIDVVDVFRRSEDIPDVVDSVIESGTKALWLQEGVVNAEAADRAAAAGIEVVMDRCMLKEHSRHEI